MNNKAIIIYQTSKTGNTKKIADIVAKILDCECVDVATQQPADLSKYTTVCFGSGIYAGSFGRKLCKYVKTLQTLPAQVFLFSTHGGSSTSAQKRFNKLLSTKNVQATDVFSCLGRDTFFTIFKKNGGFNKDRPNAEDLQKAEQWANQIANKIK